MSAEDRLSPGVSIHENNLSGYDSAVSTSGGAVVGQFDWGPAFDLKTVTKQQELVGIFNTPSPENTVSWFTAANFLDYSSNLTLVRVVTDSLNATAYGPGVQIQNSSHFFLIQESLQNSSAEFAAIYPGRRGNGIRVSIADSHTFHNWKYKSLFSFAPGTSEYAKAIGATNDEVHIVVIDEFGTFSNTKGKVLESYQFLSKSIDAKGLDNSFSFYGSVINKDSKYVRYLGKPRASYFNPAGSISGTVTITNPGTGYTTAPVVSFIGGSGTGLIATAHLGTEVGVDDTTVTSITITNMGSGYTSAPTIQLTGGGGTGATATLTYSDSNVSVSSISVSNGGTGYTGATINIAPPSNYIVGTNIPITGIPATAEAVIVGGIITAITITNPGSGYIAGSTPVITITGNGTGAIATAVMSTSDLNNFNNTSALWGTPCFDPVGDVPVNFQSLLSHYDVKLSNGTNDTTITTDDIIAGWNMFKDADKVSASLMILGDANHLVIQHVIDNICEVRKDCIAFFSPSLDECRGLDQLDAKLAIIAKRNLINRSSSYAVMDSGWKLQFNKWTGQSTWTPLNADVAGLCALVDKDFDSWWSPAGFNRGQIKNVISLAYNPSKESRDGLYPNNINPVVSFKGEGTILFGDKTLQAKASAFQWINVRRLFIALELTISKGANYQLFEFNDRFSRTQFVGIVEPFLREVQGRRGIYEYKIICDESNNTPEVVDTGEFIATILIKPTRSINYITLNFVATKSGISFDEVA